MVYAQLIVRESLRHGGKSWLTYDKVFRQQAALDGSLRWNELHPAILASTMLVSPLPSAQAPQGRAGTFCSLCQGVDHQADQCALSYLHHSDTRSFGGRGLGTSNRICQSWNRGSCRFPGGCTFRHVCRVCCQPHPEIHCPSKSTQGLPQGPPPGQPRLFVPSHSDIHLNNWTRGGDFADRFCTQATTAALSEWKRTCLPTQLGPHTAAATAIGTNSFVEVSVCLRTL